MYENNLWTLHPSILNEEDNIDGMLINAIEYDSQGVIWIGAGDYENTDFGKIAFKTEDDWHFLDNNSEELPGVNLFKESLYDLNTIYAASNDGLLIIDTNCLTLSTSDYIAESNDVTVFPNPSTGILNISMKNSRPFSFQLINSLGQIVLSKTNFLNQTIDISRFSSGVYTLIMQIEDKTLNKKILKFNK